MLPHPAGKQHTADQGFAKRQLGACGVRYAERRPMALCSPDKSGVKQAMGPTAIFKCLAFQLQDGLTCFLYCRCRWERRSERHGHGVGKQLRPLPKETAFFETEDAAPELV